MTSAAGELLSDDEAAAVEAAVDAVLAAHRGDARAAVRALLLANARLEDEIDEIVGAVSAGYVRARLHARR